MIAWEHLVKHAGYDPSEDTDDLGWDGWELTAIYPDGRLIYKRLSLQLCIKTPLGMRNVHDLFTKAKQ
jgi:hypothetical protein